MGRQKSADTGKDRRAAAASATGPDPDTPDPVPARVVQKKEFLERVLTASGASRATAKPIIEAVLDQLGQALAAGETLAIPPFGKARVSRHKDVRGSEVITLRLRRKPANGGTDDDD